MKHTLEVVYGIYIVVVRDVPLEKLSFILKAIANLVDEHGLAGAVKYVEEQGFVATLERMRSEA